MIGRHTAAKKMLRILYIAYMVDISRAKSATIKGILTSAKYREIFPMVRLSKIKRSPTNTGVLTMTLRELIQQVKRRLPLRVGASREQLHLSGPNLCLSMTLLNPLHPSITRTLEGRWNRRGLMSLHLLCSKGQGPSALGPDFTLTTYTPLYLSPRITGSKSFKKQS